jgi:hypothetical protein
MSPACTRSRQMKHYQLIGRTPVSRCQGAAGADDPLARPFHTRPQAGKGGQDNRKQGTDGKRAACSDSAYSPAPSTALLRLLLSHSFKANGPIEPEKRRQWADRFWTRVGLVAAEEDGFAPVPLG